LLFDARGHFKSTKGSVKRSESDRIGIETDTVVDKGMVTKTGEVAVGAASFPLHNLGLAST
jgi:hypothetical protein